MKIKLTFSIFILIYGLFSFTQPSYAQESNEEFSQTLLVQTDSENSIPNFPVTCFEIPNSLEPVTEEDITQQEYVTNESGEITIQSETEKNSHYYCEATQPATDDGCWYFPNQSTRFKLTESSSQPAFLIALPATETCNSGAVDAQNRETTTALLPSGTPAPIENTNVNDTKQISENQDVPDTQETTEPTSVWEWIRLTIQNLFK